MMQEMAFSVVAALLFSLIEAFLILPAHLSSKKALENKKMNPKIRLVLAIIIAVIAGYLLTPNFDVNFFNNIHFFCFQY